MSEKHLWEVGVGNLYDLVIELSKHGTEKEITSLMKP